MKPILKIIYNEIIIKLPFTKEHFEIKLYLMFLQILVIFNGIIYFIYQQHLNFIWLT